ncbi:MAG: lysophospholipid acyltransferase family protein [Chitinophagales bacterium]|nr:lysophospholipid acyltransferase family protein [Chitinophagales bacterium]
MDWFGRWYVPWLLRRHFEAVHFFDAPQNVYEALLVLSNHQSWWDPFLMIRANQHFIHKKYFVMMLEHELRRRPLLRHAGAFSVRPGSRTVIHSLDYAAGLLQHNSHLLHVFPQGQIVSVCAERVLFRSGVRYLLQQARPAFRVCFSAFFIHYFNKPRPEAFAFFALQQGLSLFSEVNQAYEQFYQHCRQQIGNEFQKRFG